jgi:phospholipid/cholesterol/gamma-HCH transport system permease protein
MEVLIDGIAFIGAEIIDGTETLGRFVLFLFSSLFYLVTPPYKPRLAIRQIRIIGAESIFLITLIALFTGMVFGLQVYSVLRRFGAEGFLGTVVSLTLVRELGPVLTALMIAARAGSAMAAELGSMQVTEQVDALTVMAINPLQYLVSPRMLAGLLSFPLLTAIFNVIGILAAYMIGVGLMGASSASYFSGIANNLKADDIWQSIDKSLVFGLVVTWVSCYKGYHAERMATGISRATTEAVVYSSVLVLVWDYLLDSILV